MRNLFRGHYRPTEEEFNDLWDNCIFSFDANILLNVYRYSPKARARFFDILDQLQERTWLPYQVAHEYQKNRLSVISEQLQPHGELRKSLDEHLKAFQTILGNYSKRHSFGHFVDVKQVLGTIERAYEKVKKVLDESSSSYPDLLDHDDFQEKLTDLFDGRVGQPYSEEELAGVYKDAEKRFKSSQPPGYMDSRGGNKKEPPECYGDVVIWLQLISHASEQKKPVIFVTDDQKEDWWLERRGRTLGPRPELVQEMFDKANVSFYLYTGERFLDQASTFLSLSSQPEIIEEAREIGLQDIEQQEIISLEKIRQSAQDSAILLKAIDEKQRLLLDPTFKRLEAATQTPIEMYREQMQNISQNSMFKHFEQIQNLSLQDPSFKRLEQTQKQIQKQIQDLSLQTPILKYLEQVQLIQKPTKRSSKSARNQSQSNQDKQDQKQTDNSDLKESYENPEE